MNKRLLSMFLALCMIMTMLPVSAMAEETYMNNDTSGEIISFAPLTETEKKVSPGTSIEDLELPKTLTATVRTTISSESSEEEILTENLEDDLIDNSIPEDSEQDSGSLEEDAAIGDSVVATTSTAIEAEINELGEKGKATKPEWEETTVDIPVRWDSLDYDMDTEGKYVFTPVIEGYTVRTDLPEIAVTIEAAIMGRTISPLLAEPYELWVGGVQVTDDNMDDVLGTADGDGATVSYDPDTNTLTLDNANITNGYNTTIDDRNVQFGIYSTLNALKLVVVGTTP